MVDTVTPNFFTLDGIDTNRPIHEVVAEFMVKALENTRDVVKSYVEGLKGAEKAQFEKIQEQIEDHIEKLKKDKQGGLLGVIFKILGALAVAFAFVCAVVAPTPMTIALLIVTIAMFLEPIIADAAGYDSLIQQAMSGMVEKFSEAFGKVGGMIMATIVMLLAVVACTGLLTAGFTALASSTAAMLQNIRTFATAMITALAEATGGGLSASAQAAVRQFLEYVQAALMIAQGGVGIEFQKLKYESAQLLHEIEVDQVIIDAWTETINMLTHESDHWQETLQLLLDMIPEIFGAAH